MRLPSKDSAVARALRTFIYTLLPLFISAAADPQVIKSVNQYAPWLLPVIVGGAPVAALVYNFFRKDVPNL